MRTSTLHLQLERYTLKEKQAEFFLFYSNSKHVPHAIKLTYGIADQGKALLAPIISAL